jgi:hypothetical protein
MPEPQGEPAASDNKSIRPEPRYMKERAAAAPIAPRHSTGDDHMRPKEPIQSRSARSRRFLHLAPAAGFCALASAVCYMLVYFFLPTGPAKRIQQASEPLAVPPPKEGAADARAAQASSASATGPLQVLEADATPPVAPAPAPDAAAPAPAGAEEESPAVTANNLLDAFLAAKDAAARVGMVEPAATAEELQATLLKGPLPEVSQVFTDLPQHDAVEDVTDYPYRVTFVLPNNKSVDYAMLVRQRGKQPPKVFLPAFLDLAGGRLFAFTKEPNDSEPTTFHVILEPISGCHEDTVPNPDRKFTFKLLASLLGRETSRAYVSTGSRFRKMVEDPTSSLRWATRVRATVTLQWNRTEDPEKPYLELININSLNWNP